MFYSQIQLTKKGPLAKVWMAAHNWNDKKIGGRPQIFATDIAASVDSIVHPTVPLALRLSGHLLWGVVRIYSKKVHYLLHDCHQAVLKLKVAFRNNNPAEQVLVIDLDERRRKRKSTQTAEDVVPHFGEFTQGDEAPILAGAFQVPVTWNELAGDQDDWIPAELEDDEDEEEDDDVSQQQEVDAKRAAAMEQEPEEEWTAFDPDDDEEEDQNRPRLKDDEEDSKVSDIEMTRAAVDESLQSEGLTRQSVLDQKVGLPSTPQATLDDDGGFMPDDSPPIMHDDDDQAQLVPPSENSKNRSAGLSVGDESSVAMSIGGLSKEDDDASAKKRKAEGEEGDKPKPKRRRKAKRKRQIVLNEQLELTGAFIRASLEDTSDIVRQDVVHPATFVPGKEPEKRQHPNTEVLYEKLPYERLFARPSLGDDGHLAPELLELWGRHTAVVVGKPFPYELLNPEEQDIEQARHEQSDEGSDGKPASLQDDDAPILADDDEDRQPMMDDDDGPPLPDDDDMVPGTDEDEENEEMGGLADSPDSRNSALSFSLVNDLLGGGDEDDEDNPRQTLGSDELIASKTKWHKHTVQVFSYLKSRMSSGKTQGDDESAEDAPEKPSHLSYNSLSRGSSRRTAATVFLELLQLKTWDYVELDQDENFGDITILPGAKFDDEVPTKD